ncbi:MAG: signal peptidase I [Roseburia inulinivorans]|nr:signal peptidase I [Roseburia inulinivorans]
MKKVWLTLVNIISIGIIIGAIFILFLVIMTAPGKVPQIGGYTVLRVVTGSMAPTLETDTLIVVQKTEPAEVKEGDIISFYSSDPALEGAVNTHRVLSIREEDGIYYYTTKGDANNVADSYEASSVYLIGTVCFSSYVMGKLARLLANPLIFIPVILIPLAVILICDIARTVKIAGRIAKEEEEEAVREAIRQIQENKKEEKK